AFRKMREQIDNMTRDAEFGTTGEHEEILETYRMFAYDEGWSRRINAAIDSGLTAEAAIERVQQRTRARMREIDDPLLQERMHDIRHSVEDGETILVDGDNGSVIIRPTRPLLAGFEHRMALSQKRRAEFAAIRNLPAITKDKVQCSVMVNAGLAEDAAALPM